MRTDDLVDLLATNAAAEPQQRPLLLWMACVVVGALLAGIIMLAWLGLDGARLARMVVTPAWWAKAGLGLSMALIGLLAATQLARPGRGRSSLVWALVPLGLIWAAALLQLAGAPQAERAALILGGTWKACPTNVAILSAPAFVAALWVMRQMAPTRPALAGAGAGLFAGGLGATVYALHCPELAPAFVGVWYVLGIAVPVLAGFVIGPRLLRW